MEGIHELDWNLCHLNEWDWAPFIPHGGSPLIQIKISNLGFSQRIDNKYILQ